MQILMTAAAHARIADRLTTIAPDLDVVVAEAHQTFSRNGQPLAESEVDPQIVWASTDSYPAKLLSTLFQAVLKASDPKWMPIFAAGIDDPAWRRVMERGVRITKSDAQATPIAEYVIAHAFSLIAPIGRQAQLQAEHRWAETRYREISQTRWLLCGYGAIGSRIAERLKPFGGHLTVARRDLTPLDGADAVVTLSDIGPALAEADVVVLACALNEATRNLAGAAFFAAMKPGAILINIGRGGLVDEDALRAGLDRDQPAQAVLDVFQTEPLPEGHWLWSHPKVRVSAHTSHAGEGTLARGDTLFLENLRRYLAGEALLNEASPAEVGL